MGERCGLAGMLPVPEVLGAEMPPAAWALVEARGQPYQRRVAVFEGRIAG